MFRYMWKRVFKRSQPVGVLPRLAAPEPWPEREPELAYAYLRDVFNELKDRSPVITKDDQDLVKKTIYHDNVALRISRDPEYPTLLRLVVDGSYGKAEGVAYVRRNGWTNSLVLHVELEVDYKTTSFQFTRTRTVFAMRRAIARWMSDVYKATSLKCLPRYADSDEVCRGLALQYARSGSVVPEALRKYLPADEPLRRPVQTAQPKGCVEQVAEAGLVAGAVGVIVADDLTGGLSTAALGVGLDILELFI